MPFTPKQRYFLLLVLSLLLLGTVGLWYWGYNRPYAMTEVVLPMNAHQLRASLYQPKPRREAGLAAVLLLHDTPLNRQSLDFLARLLVRKGFMVLSLDFGGHGESDPRPQSELENLHQTQAALSWLRQFQGVDNRRIGLIGHGMGAVAAQQALAQDVTLQAAVLLGIPPTASTDCRSGFGLGLYDAHLDTPLDVHQVAASCDSLLVVSPFSSHWSILSDPWLLEQATAWLAQRLSQPTISKTSDWREFWLDLSLQLYLSSWLGLLLWLLWRPEHGWGELVLLTLGLGILLLLPPLQLLDPLPVSGLCLCWLGLIWLRQALSPSALALWKIWGILAGAACLSWQCIALLQALVVWKDRPQALLFFPVFFLQELRTGPAFLLHSLRPWFFEEYTWSLLPAWPLGVGVALEWFWPGWLVQGLRVCGIFFTRLLTRALTPPLSAIPWHMGLMAWLLVSYGYFQLEIQGHLSQSRIIRLLLILWGVVHWARWGLQKIKTCPRDDSNVRPTI